MIKRKIERFIYRLKRRINIFITYIPVLNYYVANKKYSYPEL